MSNGAECCAIGVCCPAAERREKLAATMAEKTGADAEQCGKMLDWMEAEGLCFAPAAFQGVMDHIVAVARMHQVG